MNFGEYDESAQKKQKQQESGEGASKVLHCRNVPADATEAELAALASPFGRVTNVLLLRGKQQAFIQMDSPLSSLSLLQYYSSVQPTLRGKTIYFQYSKREEITNDSPPQRRNNEEVEVQSSILLVTILNVQYPITIDILHRVFVKYGEILKIIIFSKPDKSKGSLQAFIQYANISSSIHAKSELENQNIYSGCCTLRIQYSQLSNLNVKFNNDKCRDFTNPNLPYSDSPSGLFPDPVPYYHQGPAYSANKNAIPSCVLIASGIDHASPDELFTLFGVYGDVVRVKILYNKKDTALLQFTTPQHAATAMEYLDGLSFRGSRLKISYSKHQSISLPKPSDSEDTAAYTKDYSNSPLHRYKIVGSKNFQHITPPSAVLHISNIPLDIDEEEFSNLFCDETSSVVAIKFFSKDRRMALVEFESVEEAVEELINMHNYSINNQNIRVSFSKTSISSPH